MITNKFYFAGPCAVLFVAACDALRIEPCKNEFPCIKENARRGSILKFIRQCWRFVPLEAQSITFQRLQVCHFAGDHGYMKSIADFLSYYDGNTLLAEQVQEQFDQWKESFRTPQSPTKTIMRILNSRSPLTIEAAAYILEPTGQETKHRLGEWLLKELQRACYFISFAAPDFRNQYLHVQFHAHSPVELRKI